MDIPPTPRIKDLKEKVYSYSRKSKLPYQLEDIWYSNKIYIVIPSLILFLLCLFRPTFLYNESTDKNGNINKHFSFQKLLSFWLFFSIILNVSLFGYRYKNIK